MQKRKGFNWFLLFMFLVVAYFSTVLISQQVHLSHVSETQLMADKRLEKAQRKMKNFARNMKNCRI